MRKQDYTDIANPEHLIASARREFGKPSAEAHRDHGPLVSIREAEHSGHVIVIRTEYSIEVDGKPVSGHLAVTDDGQVHYHAVPNYSFASAVDLVKQLIDEYPEEFTTRRHRRKTRGDRSDGGHHH